MYVICASTKSNYNSDNGFWKIQINRFNIYIYIYVAIEIRNKIKHKRALKPSVLYQFTRNQIRMSLVFSKNSLKNINKHNHYLWFLQMLSNTVWFAIWLMYKICRYTKSAMCFPSLYHRFFRIYQMWEKSRCVVLQERWHKQQLYAPYSTVVPLKSNATHIQKQAIDGIGINQTSVYLRLQII